MSGTGAEGGGFRLSGKDDSSTGIMAQGSLIGSIVIIIVVVLIVNTTLDYSGPLATETTGTTSTNSNPFPLSLSSWGHSVGYPSPVWTQSCVASGGYVYCSGGLNGTNTVNGVLRASYYAQLTPSGVGNWAGTTSYPTPIRAESCVVSGGTIYCVGGYTNAAISNLVYYAPVTTSGIGQWSATISYPIPVWGHSCAASSGMIFCVGGITGSNTNTSAVYYAPLYSDGVGQWKSTSSYPRNILQQSCVGTDADVYCIGGLGSTDVYYAPVSSSGLGPWIQTTKLPYTNGADYPACAAEGGEIYCVGGYDGPSITNAVHAAPLSSSGVGAWTSSASYPVPIWGTSCVASGEGVVCIGGETPTGTVNGVYSA